MATREELKQSAREAQTRRSADVTTALPAAKDADAAGKADGATQRWIQVTRPEWSRGNGSGALIVLVLAVIGGVLGYNYAPGSREAAWAAFGVCVAATIGFAIWSVRATRSD